MRPGADYVALRDIKAPDSYAYAARAGHDVTEMQRVNLHLTVGVDVLPLTTTAMERPADDADRRQWQDYAVVRGVPYDEAVNLDRAELLSRIKDAEKQDAEPLSAGTMPGKTDKADRWREYAALEILRRTGGTVTHDEARERVKNRTRNDLIDAFGPDAAPGAEADLIATDQPPGPAAQTVDPPAASEAQSGRGRSADAVADQGNPVPEK